MQGTATLSNLCGISRKIWAHESVALLACLLVAGGCSKQSTAPAAAESSSGQIKVGGGSVKAVKGPIEQTVILRGTVRSSNRIEMRAERKVKISKNRVKNFESVKKGQVLLEVDNSETESKVREFKEKSKTMDLEFQSVNIKYKHAQKVVDRKKSLFDKGIIAQKEFDEATRDFRLSGSEIRAKELEMEKLGREVSEATDQLKSSHFVAPMDGMVTGLVVPDVGGTEVQPGQSIATVSDPGKLALWVGVEEANLHKVKQEMKASIKLDSVPNEKFDGRIISIGTSEMPGGANRGRLYEVGISFATGGKAIREGYSGKAKISFESKPSAITVPVAALRYLDGKDYVSVAQGLQGSPTAKLVTVGIRTDTEVEILSGVSENDTIFLAANDK